jgi:serine/threonine protein kinase
VHWVLKEVCKMRHELKHGDELLGCRIVRLMESGEETDLYEAEDLHTSQRLAVEQLLPGDDLRAYEMLRRRMAAFRPLNHPNLCAVYRVGEHGGLECVIMEYLTGGMPLLKILRNGSRLPISAKLNVIRQACDTLSYLHQNGFPFLNIKPSKIILLPDHQIKIVDYWAGVFRARTNLTTGRAAVGDVLYVAPERLRGVAYDHRADIWSIGVMFYQLLTNRNPFSDLDSATVASILNDPVPPLKGDLRDCAAGLDSVLKKALAKNPENRYESSQEMASALKEIEHTLADRGREQQGEVRSVTQPLRITEPSRESPARVTRPIQRINSRQTNEQLVDRPSMSPDLWQRLKPLYARALEMAPFERERFVNEAFGTDVRLREELKALLNSPSQLDTLDNPFLRIPNPFSPETYALAEGKTILGRFTVVKRLGAGGMGEVYEAIDSELGRIALKTIRPELATNENPFQRFRKEVQLARKITSLHVCRVHEFFPAGCDDLQSHPAFLTMELLEGVTLANRIRDLGQLDPREAREIAIEACEGLNAIHDAGVIHRDLKSQNVMLAVRAGRKCVVLMDFGVAHEMQRPESGRGELTGTGAIVGTPNYMAPEQFEGKPTTPATDLYALGIILYEMVTGTSPFAASTPIGAAVQRGKQPASVSSLRPELSRHWDTIIEKCLEFRAEDRYQTASDLKHDLEIYPISRSGTLGHRALRSVKRAIKWAQSHPWR